MTFVVSKSRWLEVESARVASIIVAPRFWRRKWDDKALRRTLAAADIGLVYTEEEVKILNDELHRQGIVEDIEEAPVTPA